MMIPNIFIDPAMCYYYDALMLYIVAYDFMILRGLDYENSTLV